jgi:hypothetical protein
LATNRTLYWQMQKFSKVYDTIIVEAEAAIIEAFLVVSTAFSACGGCFLSAYFRTLYVSGY